MVEKNLYISVLLDFYGPMLTDKQREVVEYYYNEDLSLAEIADHAGITRQGVRDAIKRGEATLLEMEERLHFAERYRKREQQLERVSEIARGLLEHNRTHLFSRELQAGMEEILRLCSQMADE